MEARLFAAAALLVSAPLVSPLASAQYPAKPIRVVGPFPAGGTQDQFAQTIARDAAKWSKVIKDNNVKPE